MVIAIIVLSLLFIAALRVVALQRKALTKADERIGGLLVEADDLRGENTLLRFSNENLRSSNHNHVSNLKMVLNELEGSV